MLRRCLRRPVSEPRLLGYSVGRTDGQPAQMHVAKGERNLQRQRYQRQDRAAVLMAMNPPHPPFSPWRHMLTLPRNARQAVLFHEILGR